MHLATTLASIGFLDASIDGETILHYAAKNGKRDIMKEMVKAGATIDALDDEYVTPLMKAVEADYHKGAAYLLRHGASPNRQNGDGYNALHLATMCSDLKMVMLLLRHGADLHSVTSKQEVVLHHAVYCGDMKMVHYFIKKGVNINADSEHGSPLYLAISSGRLDLVDVLIDYGADFDQMDPNGGQTEDALLNLDENIGSLDEDGSGWESDDSDEDDLRTPNLMVLMREKLQWIMHVRSKAKEGDVFFFVDLFNTGFVPPQAQVFPLLPETARNDLIDWASTVRGDMRGLYSLYHGDHDLLCPSSPISALLCEYLVLPAATRSYLF